MNRSEMSQDAGPFVSPERGTYKIELVLQVESGERNKLIPGELRIYLSGSGTSGDMDASCFICPYCRGVIQPELVTEVFYCPHCKKGDHAELASPGLLANLTLQGWADLIHDYWKKLSGDVDLYLKKFKYRLQPAAAEKRAGGSQFTRPDIERRVRQGKRERERVLYPFANSLKDNLAGQDMRKRILAFLNA